MRHLFRIAGLLAAVSAAAPIGLAGLPLPSLTFYGLFLDEFGWPYSIDDYVEVRTAGKHILSHPLVATEGRDFNFLVRIPYDSGGRSADYSAGAISPGETVSLRLIDSRSGAVVIQTNFVCNLPPGAVVRFDSSSGGDSLGDGLPDELRLWLWETHGDGSAFDPAKWRAGDDTDGDGVNNLDEYRAGTDPANSEDLLKVAIATTDRPGVARLTFYSVPGKVYQLEGGVPGANGLEMRPVVFARSPEDAAIISEVVGTGHVLSVFVPAGDASQILRVRVNVRQQGAVLLP